MIFLDADVLFMQDPIVMFELEGYKRAGNVFFHDRQMNVGKADTHKWLETFMDPKTYSKDGEQVQFLKYGTIHEQDSGVVVINKGSSAFFGLLATCTMNRKLEREEIYKNVFGDKETFWIATELIKVPYYFPSGYGGTIGYVNPSKENSICGQLYHPDENWEPLWWNVR